MEERLIADGTVNISVPVSYAFEYVHNLENMASWFPGVLAISKIASDGESTQYLEFVEIPVWGLVEVPLFLVENELNSKLVLLGDYPLLAPKSVMVFEVISESECRLSWSMCSRRTGNIIWRKVFPVAQYVMSRRGREALKRLKMILERSHRRSNMALLDLKLAGA